MVLYSARRWTREDKSVLHKQIATNTSPRYSQSIGEVRPKVHDKYLYYPLHMLYQNSNPACLKISKSTPGRNLSASSFISNPVNARRSGP
jgi:hypothetical protein